MKKWMCITLAVLMLAVFSGCTCEHGFSEATCFRPSSCTLCGKTEGEILQHIWEEANCVSPRTCSLCKRTEGDPVGHSWLEATCADAKTCASCNAIIGTSLEHTWVEATTSVPMTCSVCGRTRGERIDTDERFTTEACSVLFGKWIFRQELSAVDIGVYDGKCTEEPFYYAAVMEFSNDGKVTLESYFEDPDAVVTALKDYYKRMEYLRYEAEGKTQTQAEAAFVMEMRTSMDDFYTNMIMEDGVVDSYSERQVYYLEGNTLHWAHGWGYPMTELTLEIEGDALEITYEDGYTEAYVRSSE